MTRHWSLGDRIPQRQQQRERGLTVHIVNLLFLKDIVTRGVYIIQGGKNLLAYMRKCNISQIATNSI